MNIRTHNLTTSFALPLLGWNRSVFKPYLIDAYIRHEGVPHFTEGHLFVLLKWSDDDRFKKLEEVLVKHPTHVSMYEPDEQGAFVMHVFKLRDVMQEDYNLFLEGKYSRMSVQAKQLILASSKPGGVTAKILNRDRQLREVQEAKMNVTLDESDEVWPCVDDMHTYHKEVFHESVLMELN
jgi:hypothetical protein